MLPLLLCIHSSGARTTDAFQLLAPNPVENILRTTSSGVIPECRKKENPQRGGNRERKQSPTKKNGIDAITDKIEWHSQKYRTNTCTKYDASTHTQLHTQKDTHAHTHKHKTHKHAHTRTHKSLTLISNTQRPSHSLYPSPATSTNTYSYT